MFRKEPGPCYIGGDEFVIIIEQAEKAICDELLRNFDDGIVVFNKNNTKYRCV